MGAAGAQSTHEGSPPQHGRTLALSFTGDKTPHRTTCSHRPEPEVRALDKLAGEVNLTRAMCCPTPAASVSSGRVPRAAARTCVTGPTGAAGGRRVQQVHSRGHTAGRDHTGPEAPGRVTSSQGLDPAHHPRAPGPRPLPGSLAPSGPPPWGALLWPGCHEATRGTQGSPCHVPREDKSFVCTDDALHSAAAVWPYCVALATSLWL